MQLLVIGGTQFLGRHIVDCALARGHDVVLFNRGLRNRELFPDVQRLIGDRNGDMSALSGQRFDSVIDCCGYTPQQMLRTAEALGDAVKHYVFVSSVSAYGSRPPHVRYDETAPLASGDVGYGEEKARAEEAISAAYPNRVAIVRPGLIVGPHDHTGRFSYWPLRYADGGHVLAPGRPERPLQWIDVRDLAEWIVTLSESNTAGSFNAITQADRFTMANLADACTGLATSPVRTEWLDDEALLAEGVAPWSELPLWIPENDADAGGMMLARADRAIEAGLQFRSIDVTVRDTFVWLQSLGEDHPARGISKTLSREREAALLTKLRLIG